MWFEIGCFLILGYLCLGRSFAYWGVPQWNLFAGEIVLGMFLLRGPLASTGRWPWAGMRLPTLHRFTLVLFLCFAYGMFQVFRGWSLGYPLSATLRGCAFHWYTLYFFLGLWIGLRRPSGMPAFFRLFAWVNGLYGIAFILVLSRLGWTIAGSSPTVADVSVLGQPEHSALALLALIALEKDLRRVWHLIAMNAFVLLGMQIRASWLAFCVGLFVWSCVTKRLRRVVLGAASVLLVLCGMYLASVELAGPETRGGSAFSTRDIVGRALAPVAPELAADYTANFQTYEDTAVWRTVWWAAIWDSVHQTRAHSLLGHGYGFALFDLVPYLQDSFIWTPHSVFFYLLGYTGWIGLLLFVLLQAELLRLLLRVCPYALQPLGLAYWSAAIAYASFTSFFEAPYGAIPFYLIAGWILAPIAFPEVNGSVPAPGTLEKMQIVYSLSRSGQVRAQP